MKERHTAWRLRQHIQDVLRSWGLETDIVTTNFNSTNPNDIVDDAEPIDSEEVDFFGNSRLLR